MSRSRYTRSLTSGVLVWAALGSFLACEHVLGQQANQVQPSGGNIIHGRGIIEPTGYDEISSKAVQPLPVLFVASYGSTVKKGDLLVELDTASLRERVEGQHIEMMRADAELKAAEASSPGAMEEARSAVAIAEQALRLAQDELKTYTADEYPPQVIAIKNEITMAQERLTIAEERLHIATRNMSEVKSQVENSEQKELFIKAGIARMEAKVQLEALRTRQTLLEKTYHPRKIDQLKLVIAQRGLDLLRARNELARITMRGEAGVAIARAVRQTEMGRLQLLEHQLSVSTLHAPRDGTVFSPNDSSLGAPCEAEARPGDTVPFGQVFLRLADLTQLKLDVGLALPLAHKLAPGQAATVHCDAFPSRTFRSHVTRTRVLTDPDTTGDPTEAIVTVRLDNPVKGLKPGMAATVEFDVSSAQLSQ